VRDLLYIVGGVAGGWMLGRALFGKSMRANPEFTLDWQDDEGEPSKFESRVFSGDQEIGSIIMTTPGAWWAYDSEGNKVAEVASSGAAGQAVYDFSREKSKAERKPKKDFWVVWETRQEGEVRTSEGYIGSITMIEPGEWQAFEGTRIDPFREDLPSGKKAAEAVYRRWAGLPEPLPEPTLVEVTVPDWVKGIEVEPTVGGKGERYIVWLGDDRAGVIERRARAYDAWVHTRDGLKQLELRTTRKNAVVAVYVAATILRYLPTQVEFGKQRSYVPKRFKTLPTKRGQRPRGKEIFYRDRHYSQKTADEISGILNIPEKLIIRYGVKLAEYGLIYAVLGFEQKRSFKRMEKRPERVIPPRGHIPGEVRRRRVVERPDIKKLRKSEALTKEQKKSIPMARMQRIYRFAQAGQKGEVGYYGEQERLPSLEELWGIERKVKP